MSLWTRSCRTILLMLSSRNAQPVVSYASATSIPPPATEPVRLATSRAHD